MTTISEFLLTRNKVILKEVQSFTGLLSFACSVVVPGRAFLRRLIDLSLGIRFLNHFIRLTIEVKLDLQLWQSFLSNFNGRIFFLEGTWSSFDNRQPYTDAVGALGFGAVFGSKWWEMAFKLAFKLVTKNIAFLEIYPIVLSLQLWEHEMQNRWIIFLH